MTWYKARIPDAGSKVTHLNVYVEGGSEQVARERIDEHERYTMYDASAGALTEVTELRSEIEDRLGNAGNPNEALTRDGDVLLNDRENDSVRTI